MSNLCFALCHVCSRRLLIRGSKVRKKTKHSFILAVVSRGQVYYRRPFLSLISNTHSKHRGLRYRLHALRTKTYADLGSVRASKRSVPCCVRPFCTRCSFYESRLFIAFEPQPRSRPFALSFHPPSSRCTWIPRFGHCRVRDLRSWNCCAPRISNDMSEHMLEFFW